MTPAVAEPLTPEEEEMFRQRADLGYGVTIGQLRRIWATLDAARAAAPLDVIEWLGPCCTHPTPGCTVCGFIPEEARRG